MIKASCPLNPIISQPFRILQNPSRPQIVHDNLESSWPKHSMKSAVLCTYYIQKNCTDETIIRIFYLLIQYTFRFRLLSTADEEPYQPINDGNGRVLHLIAIPRLFTRLSYQSVKASKSLLRIKAP